MSYSTELDVRSLTALLNLPNENPDVFSPELVNKMIALADRDINIQLGNKFNIGYLKSLNPVPDVLNAMSMSLAAAKIVKFVYGQNDATSKQVTAWKDDYTELMTGVKSGGIAIIDANGARIGRINCDVISNKTEEEKVFGDDPFGGNTGLTVNQISGLSN